MIGISIEVAGGILKGGPLFLAGKNEKSGSNLLLAGNIVQLVIYLFFLLNAFKAHRTTKFVHLEVLEKFESNMGSFNISAGMIRILNAIRIDFGPIFRALWVSSLFLMVSAKS